ncbi:hypothetical protein, partial [Brevibacillus brevis]|uniref:hypothetical protein n=1 Tax=Brevibacillus brevis TaxID=1393 RepID=UPI003D1C6A41
FPPQHYSANFRFLLCGKKHSQSSLSASSEGKTGLPDPKGLAGKRKSFFSGGTDAILHSFSAFKNQIIRKVFGVL